MSVRVGIVSFSHVHSPAYAGVLGDLDTADFVGITDEDAGRGAKAAEQFGVRFFHSAHSLFEEVEAVVVCSENKNHARDVIPALQGGVHVLCEKPIATTVEDARAMIQTSENSSSQLRTTFPVRYLPRWPARGRSFAAALWAAFWPLTARTTARSQADGSSIPSSRAAAR